ncbi:MAG TPA: CHRD domain-containing protein [Novosphingobium sp.]|nr:CHRD domain-containing protein [Novosphingobium sp.]
MRKIHLLIGVTAATALLGACATVEEAVAEKTTETYKAELRGANEPGGGDPDGSGSAEISISDNFGEVCWDLNNITNIGPVTAAHIHRGAAGVNGPVVYSLKPANEGGWKGCADATEWTQDRIDNNPGAFYVNVHTAQYPNGAIRGQLHQ